VHSWQEAPETLTTILHQRTRWFLGVLEVAFSFGRLLRKPSPKTFDAETVFFSPFVLIASLLGYFVGPFLLTSTPWAASLAITFAGWLLLMLGVLVTGVVLMQAAKPTKARDLLWIPFIHGYWFLQSFLAIWALIKTTLGIPGEWKKTPKTGTIDSADFSAQSRVKTEIRQKKE
jgi:cellulose synthase/poly-beta-1,6-N-acetylglucosamine synthase-like glycosyltransferase